LRRQGPVASADEAWAIRGMWAWVVNMDDVRDSGHGEGARMNVYNLRMRGDLSNKMDGCLGQAPHTYEAQTQGRGGRLRLRCGFGATCRARFQG
jgi:hypothetical protein